MTPRRAGLEGGGFRVRPLIPQGVRDVWQGQDTLPHPCPVLLIRGPAHPRGSTLSEMVEAVLFPEGFLVEVFVARGRKRQSSTAHRLDGRLFPAEPTRRAPLPQHAPPHLRRCSSRSQPPTEHGPSRAGEAKSQQALVWPAGLEELWAVALAGLSVWRPFVCLAHLRSAVLTWLREVGPYQQLRPRGLLSPKWGQEGQAGSQGKNLSVQGQAGHAQGPQIPVEGPPRKEH